VVCTATGAVSAAGQLPCALFGDGGCGVAALPEAEVLRQLASEPAGLKAYAEMMGRLAHQRAEREAEAATMTECAICFEDYPEAAGVRCGGAEPHFLGNGCVVERVRSACTATAAGLGSEFFTAATNESGASRARGEIPCPFFSSGCSCAALPHAAFLAALLSAPAHAATLRLYEDSCAQLGAIEAGEREAARRAQEAEEQRRREAEGLPGRVAALAERITSVDGPPSHGRCSHSYVPLYIPMAILHTKQIGGHENESTAHG
jgi:hypothetical protein